MKAHQIIQTSCKRGFGTGSGFQVFSCDEETAQSGMVSGAEYQKLFVYDTPVEVGVPAFGYAQVEEVGDVFNLNTRLPHDYAGEGTRSGNLLNHAVFVEEGLSFYPMEVYGSACFRTEMDPSEVNSDDAPDYLPLLDLCPASKITIGEVSEWVEDGDRLDVVEALLSATFDAMANNKVVVVIDDVENVARWIAAVEFCLPLGLAKQIRFLTYSENPGTGVAHLVGTNKRGLDNMPPYAQASCIVFNIVEGVLPDYPFAGAFLDFIDTNFDLNPEGVARFASFADKNLKLGFNLSDFSKGYSVYSLSNDPVSEWSATAIEEGLAFALSDGEPALRKEISRILIDSFTQLSRFGSDVYYSILEFLIKNWDLMTDEQRLFVKRVAVANLVAILADDAVDDAHFQDYFGALTNSCSSVSLDLFSIIAEGEYRNQLFAHPDSLSVSKLSALAIALTKYVLQNRIDAVEVGGKASFASLYAMLMKNATLQSPNAALGFAVVVIGEYKDSPAHFRNIVQTIEYGMACAFAAGGSDASLEKRTLIDQLWDNVLDILANTAFDSSSGTFNWLVWLSNTDQGGEKDRLIADCFGGMLHRCETVQQAEKLFSDLVKALGRAKRQTKLECISNAGSQYVSFLSGRELEESKRPMASLLDWAIESRDYYQFVPRLVAFVSDDFSLKKLGQEETELIRMLESYEVACGHAVLCGRAALLAPIVEMKSASRGFAVDIFALFDEMHVRDVTVLAKKDWVDYLELLAPPFSRCCMEADEIEVLFSGIAMDEKQQVHLVRLLYKEATGPLLKRGDARFVVMLNAFVCFAGNRDFDDACIKGLSSIKEEKLAELVYRPTVQEVRALSRRGYGPQLSRRWDSLYQKAAVRSSKGLLGRMMG